MIVGVPKETAALERRVSLVPETVSKIGAGVSVVVEKGAGEGAGFADSDYAAAGATLAADAKSLYGQADVILKVAAPTLEEASAMKEGAIGISFLYPLANIEAVKKLASRKATAFAMELIPRISRAQPMDALSSQANLAGYKAVILAADTVPKLFPLMMTAAGTISPAKVFILGAGVAGLRGVTPGFRFSASKASRVCSFFPTKYRPMPCHVACPLQPRPCWPVSRSDSSEAMLERPRAPWTQLAHYAALGRVSSYAV
jgi:NAD(P) transhydrogenase subunit alpha